MRETERDTEVHIYRKRNRERQRNRDIERVIEIETQRHRERERERSRAERGRESCLHGKPASLAEEEIGKKFNVIFFLPTRAQSCVFLCRVLGTV